MGYDSVTRGRINENREPHVFLTVAGNSGVDLRIDFLVDTGHYGQLVLPSAIVQFLALTPTDEISDVTVAGGGKQGWPVYRANVYWGGRLRDVEVLESDTPPLFGMAMIYDPASGHADRLIIDASDRSVLIEHNPPASFTEN